LTLRQDSLICHKAVYAFASYPEFRDQCGSHIIIVSQRDRSRQIGLLAFLLPQGRLNRLKFTGSWVVTILYPRQFRLNDVLT
jgi:hypothetical protein